MCYDTLSLTKRSLDYAQRMGFSPETQKELEEQFQRLKRSQQPLFHAPGFAHPTLPTMPHPDAVELSVWGLVPHWVRTADEARKIWNKTLNARMETLFDKPSFRTAARKGRCLVVTDGFFEHHHLPRKTQAFLIQHQQEQPLILGGIQSLWIHPETDALWRTFSIVTGPANALLRKIHNNPKVASPRMPLILSPGEEEAWLSEDEREARALLAAYQVQPFPAEALKAHPVAPLRGKQALGNRPEALEEIQVKELPAFWAND